MALVVEETKEFAAVVAAAEAKYSSFNKKVFANIIYKINASLAKNYKKYCRNFRLVLHPCLDEAVEDGWISLGEREIYKTELATYFRARANKETPKDNEPEFPKVTKASYAEVTLDVCPGIQWVCMPNHNIVRNLENVPSPKKGRHVLLINTTSWRDDNSDFVPQPYFTAGVREAIRVLNSKRKAERRRRQKAAEIVAEKARQFELALE